MSTRHAIDPTTIRWEVQPQAWAWLLAVIERACSGNGFLEELRQRMLLETGTRLVDWLDHVCLSASDADRSQLAALGFVESEAGRWNHPGGLFPELVFETDHAFPRRGLALRVESIDAFVQAHPRFQPERVGVPHAPLRWAVIQEEQGQTLTVVERHGQRGYRSPSVTEQQLAVAATSCQTFARRPRPWLPAERTAGFAAARDSFRSVAAVLGRDWACDRFFASERDYWLSRNDAAQLQYERQNRLGLGWANHDHHTYRSSREHFADLIATLEEMGFVCRERFYAGAEAGWGAQVLEQSACGLVVFADVDMSPDEVAGDFAHGGLPARDRYGTVGLWCQLHGEAFLSAGLHHLECQFDFAAARAQLSSAGVGQMAPFTDFTFLRQAFTAGQMWPVPADRLEQLVARRVISPTEAEQFAREGARGSHLEILQRDDGYKGFNQTGISDIIQRTDPRWRDA